MKQIITVGIITLVSGLIIAYFAFYLNKEFVDLRYTISEKIPTKYIESSAAEAVQQLVVKNNGNIPAEKIQIKIMGKIIEYDILKHSVSDKVEEHYSNEHFEAIYPSLPPGAQFSYIFKTSGMGLTKKLIEITHNKGKGIEALSSDVTSNVSEIFFWVSLAIIAFYFVLSTNNLRSIYIDILKSSGSHTGISEYLSKSKPFYISQNEWDSIRIEYIKNKDKVENFYATDIIEELESYKILNQDKPDYLSDSEWDLLKEKTTKCLVDFLSYSIKTSTRLKNVAKYFTIKKPVAFPDKQWEKITEGINRAYLESNTLDGWSYLSSEKIINELNAGMPNGMSDVYWNQYKEYLLKRYYEIIYSNLLNETHPINFLKTVDLSILDTKKQEHLKSFAYKIELKNFENISSLDTANKFLEKEKPNWISTEDLKEFEKKAQEYVELDRSANKYKSLLSALTDIVNSITLKEKPNVIIDDKEWAKITELESKVSSIAIKIEKDKEKLETEKQETQELKDKILKQLRIINDTLTDPKSIDKIEPYDNPFSKGNFENLQVISSLLKEQ